MKTLKSPISLTQTIGLTILCAIVCYLVGFVVFEGIYALINMTNETIGKLIQSPDLQVLASTVPLAGASIGENATVKGNKKLRLSPLFTLGTATTKTGKPAHVVLFNKKNEKSMELAERMADFCKLANVAFWVWPTQSPDKDQYIAKGCFDNGLFILNDIENFTFARAKEYGKQIANEKAQDRDAKKNVKKATGNAVNVAQAKIQAIKDMIADGTLDAASGAQAIAAIV